MGIDMRKGTRLAAGDDYDVPKTDNEIVLGHYHFH